MVLADSSAWICFLRASEPYLSDLTKVLADDLVVSHDLVYGELLIGDVGGRSKFLADYAFKPRAAMAPHEEVVYLTRIRKLHGRGLSWIDVHLLASAIVGRHQLFTADQTLAQIADELGVGFRPKRA